MKLSIVVPTFNRRELLKRTLATLFAQTCAPADFEIIVVVDGSSDGTAAAIRALNSPCALRVIEQPNRGPAAARNAGFRAARADLVLFLDDDMLCVPELAATHIAAHHAAEPLIAHGAIRLSADSPRTLAAACFAQEFAPHSGAWERGKDSEWLNVPIVFSNTSLPRRLLIESGGFDEAFRMREDLELGYRLLQVGARPTAVPDAVAYQQYDKTARQLLRDAEVFAEGDVLFARKHPENRVQGQLNWLAAQPRARLQAHRLALAAPLLTELLLIPACWLGQALIALAPCRSIGVRALQLRRRLRWLHRVRELTGA